MSLPGTGAIVATRWQARFLGRNFPCAVGRGGIVTEKREGDGGSPRGAHRITGMFFRPDRIAARSLPGWAEAIGPRDLWCDDPGHGDYNHHIRAPHPAGHEVLRRPDPLYDLILTTDWNWPDAVPGKGSAIFLHAWRRPRYPTAGCLALAPADLLWVAGRVQPGTPVIFR